MELGIGGTIDNISEHGLTGYNQWNINMMSMECVGDHGIYIGQLNITFDDTTLNRIFRERTDANRTWISIRFIYKFYMNQGQLHHQQHLST